MAMVLSGDKIIKKYFGFACITGLYLLFVLNIALMWWEFVKYKYTVILSNKSMEIVAGLLLNGDTTECFHPDFQISYRIYILIYAMATVLSYIVYKYRKRKIWLCISLTWFVLFLIGYLSAKILATQMYAFILQRYQEYFITMQFLKADNILLKVGYIIIYVYFISIHCLGIIDLRK